MVSVIFHAGTGPRKLVIEFAVVKKDVGADKICNHFRHVSLEQQRLINLRDVHWIRHPTQTRVSCTVALLKIETCLTIRRIETIVSLMTPTLLYPLVQLRKQIFATRL